MYLRTQQEELLYGPIFPDYDYLVNPDRYDERIDGDEALSERDEAFKENNMPFLRRFFDLVDSMVHYVGDLVQFFNDLNEGMYINMNVTRLLLHPQGKQLVAETLYLWGVMLLLLDYHISDVVRERLMVAYYRYEGQARVADLQRVMLLCRRTGVVRELGGKLAQSAVASEPVLPLVQRQPVPGYPEELFARFPLNEDIVLMVVEQLRTDDIYAFREHFPLPSQRSVALALQGSMVYVILYFAPDVLKNQRAAMREIVDKHFPDNWVASYHSGYVVDLSVMWAPYRAAAEALNNTLELSHVESIVQKHGKRAVGLIDEIGCLLKEGVITGSYVLDNIDKLITVVREANIILRWFLLHRLSVRKSHRDLIHIKLAGQRDALRRVLQKHATSVARVAESRSTHDIDKGKRGRKGKKGKKSRRGEKTSVAVETRSLGSSFVFVGLNDGEEGQQPTHTGADADGAEGVAVEGTRRGTLAQQLLLHLLLLTSQLEYAIKEHIDAILKRKEATWIKLRDQSSGYMEELSEFFSGTSAFKRSLEPNEELAAWFSRISEEIKKLEMPSGEESASGAASAEGQRIQEILKALRDNMEHHQVAPSLQVKSYIEETQDVLMKMIRTLNTTDGILLTLATVSELGFAWKTLDDIVPVLQYQIERNPSIIMQFRALSLKLQSIVDASLVRIMQANSKDKENVCEYYSGRLVAFIRRVIAVIPRAVFVKLREIIALQTTKIAPIPLRVDKDKLKSVAQLPERFYLAELTHSVSVYTRGVLEMGRTLVGVIEIDPEHLLIDGIRAELVKQVSGALHSRHSSVYSSLSSMHETVNAIGQVLQGVRTSFEYIQDYINVNGLRIWNEEFNRIIFHYVEQECSLFLSVRATQSVYQSRAIPIPSFRDYMLAGSVSFVGRFVNALISFTAPSSSVYVERMLTWYSVASEKIVFNRQMLVELRRSFQVAGLLGIDRMFAFRIVRALKRVFMHIRVEMTPDDEEAVAYARRVHAAKGKKRSMAPRGAIRAVIEKFIIGCSPFSQLPKMKVPQNLESSKRDGQESKEGRGEVLRALSPAASSRAVYDDVLASISSLIARIQPLIAEIGQLQHLRQLVCSELGFAARMNATSLWSAVDTLNDAMLRDIVEHYERPDEHATQPDERIMAEFGSYLDQMGFSDPWKKVYVPLASPVPYVHVVLFFVVHMMLHTNTLNTKISSLVVSTGEGSCGPASLKGAVDMPALLLGVMTVLRQVHTTFRQQFLSLVGQYIRVIAGEQGAELLESRKKSKKGQSPAVSSRASKAALAFVALMRYGGIALDEATEFVPPSILHQSMLTQ